MRRATIGRSVKRKSLRKWPRTSALAGLSVFLGENRCPALRRSFSSTRTRMNMMIRRCGPLHATAAFTLWTGPRTIVKVSDQGYTLYDNSVLSKDWLLVGVQGPYSTVSPLLQSRDGRRLGSSKLDSLRYTV